MRSTKKSVVKEYTEGLCWVLLYYFSGVPSWTWFYPYHYGPCASDLRGLSQVKVNFHMGLPFTPFDQLMAVLPPRSAHALPKAYRDLMTDPSSVLLRFYPKEFDVDVDGKRHLWQGVCLLPFIEEKLLLSETKEVAGKIKDYEAERNVVKVDKIFIRASSKFGSQIQSCFIEQPNEQSREGSGCIEVSFSMAGSIAGSVHLLDQPSKADKMVLCLNYELPKQREIVHRSLAGVNFPEKSVFQCDINDRLLWHEHNYHGPVSRQNPNPKTESRENSQHGKPGGRGWSSQGRGQGRAPSYPLSSIPGSSCYPARPIGNSSGRMSNYGRTMPQTYIPPHQRSGSSRPVAPFGQHVRSPRPAYTPRRFPVGNTATTQFRGNGYASINDIGSVGSAEWKPLYRNDNRRGRGRGFYNAAPTDQNRVW